MIRDDAGSADLADIEDMYWLTPMQNGLLFPTCSLGPGPRW